MFQSRTEGLQRVSRKPRIVFDRRFDIFDQLDVGEKGQLNIEAVVDSIKLEEIDGENNQHRLVTIMVNKAEIVDPRKVRI